MLTRLLPGRLTGVTRLAVRRRRRGPALLRAARLSGLTRLVRLLLGRRPSARLLTVLGLTVGRLLTRLLLTRLPLTRLLPAWLLRRLTSRRLLPVLSGLPALLPSRMTATGRSVPRETGGFVVGHAVSLRGGSRDLGVEDSQPAPGHRASWIRPGSNRRGGSP